MPLYLKSLFQKDVPTPSRPKSKMPELGPTEMGSYTGEPSSCPQHPILMRSACRPRLQRPQQPGPVQQLVDASGQCDVLRI